MSGMDPMSSVSLGGGLSIRIRSHARRRGSSVGARVCLVWATRLRGVGGGTWAVGLSPSALLFVGTSRCLASVTSMCVWRVLDRGHVCCIPSLAMPAPPFDTPTRPELAKCAAERMRYAWSTARCRCGLPPRERSSSFSLVSLITSFPLLLPSPVIAAVCLRLW